MSIVQTAATPDQPGTSEWESEGGSLKLELPKARENESGSTPTYELAKSLGVIRHLTETYSVGGFQYTNLADAIAQARRTAKQVEVAQ